MSRSATPHTGSFRDPAGFVFEHQGKLYRQINKFGKEDYEFLISSGLYNKLIDDGLLVKHTEVKEPSTAAAPAICHKVIQPERVPFVSYPYEWSFSQLKEAGLLTLRIQKLSLEHGMILKDASAYNIQFVGNRPVFIDTLSFRVYQRGAAWDGYKQFCQHFIAPLALASYGSPEMIRSLRVFLDGIPLGVAGKLLPTRAKAKIGLLAHVHLHAASQKRYDKENLKAETKTRNVSLTAMQGLVNSLEKTVRSLKLKKQATEWGDYYEDTNYSKTAFDAKKRIVSEYLQNISPKPRIVWDLGANNGTFSELASEIGAYTVAFDVDYQALELNLKTRRKDVLAEKILPLHQDFSNPSPALGWAHKERASLEQRGPADVALGLALIHHLAIGNNSPLGDIAAFFRQITKYLIIEFVPKTDSKVQILLRGRNNIFSDYNQENFDKAFAQHFKLIKSELIPGSQRVIYLYKAKA